MSKIKHTGALPFRFGDSGLEILLITARRTGRWIVPKGYWTPRLKSYQSAEKEAYEEAGIEGLIGQDAIGIYEQKSLRSSTITPIMVFPLQVTYWHGIWPEKHERRHGGSRRILPRRWWRKGLRLLIRRFTRGM